MNSVVVLRNHFKITICRWISFATKVRFLRLRIWVGAILLLLYFETAWSADLNTISCLQGSINNKQLLNQFELLKKRKSFVNEFYKLQIQNNKANDSVLQTETSSGFCQKCKSFSGYLNKFIDTTKEIVNVAAEKYIFDNKKINPMCIKASLKREDGDAYFCESENSPAVPLGKYGKTGPCISDEMAEYISWMTNEAIHCVHDVVEHHIDPSVTLAKFNNESHFAFFIGNTGGVGIGQLTSIALKDLVIQKDQTVEPIDKIQKILKSKKPSCQRFKPVLKTALTEIGSSNYCMLLNMENGFARSLIYSLVFFQKYRDDYLYPVITKKNLITDRLKSKSMIDLNNRFYMDWSALALYGPEGLKNKSMIADIYNQKPRTPQNFKDNLAKKIPYIKNTVDKENEMLNILNQSLIEPDENPEIKSDTKPDIKPDAKSVANADRKSNSRGINAIKEKEKEKEKKKIFLIKDCISY